MDAEPRNLAVEEELTQKTIILLSKNWKAFQITNYKIAGTLQEPFPFTTWTAVRL